MKWTSQLSRVTLASYVTPELIKSLCGGGDIRTVAENDVNYLVELHPEKTLRALEPDFNAIKKLPVQGIIATAPADSEEYDFVSRYFAPAVGVNEDPVTALPTPLSHLTGKKARKSNMLAQQLSAREGTIRVQCLLPNSNTAPVSDKNRILISGQAITTLKGDFLIG